MLQCFSAFADGRNVYLILEWCNMGTLKSYVENKKRLGEKEGSIVVFDSLKNSKKLGCILHAVTNKLWQL